MVTPGGPPHSKEFRARRSQSTASHRSNGLRRRWQPAELPCAAPRLLELVHVNLGIIDFLRLHDVLPGDLAFLVGGLASHQAGNGRFSALIGLIVGLAAHNAFNECLLFLGIGQFQVGAEVTRGREILGLSRIRAGASPLPGLVTPDPQPSGIGRLRSIFGLEEPFCDVPPLLCKLGRGKCHLNIIRILVQHIVVPIHISVARRASVTAAPGRSL